MNESIKIKLVDAVIEDLKESFIYKDYTVLYELLMFVPIDNLIQALPEEKQNKFLKLFLKIEIKKYDKK